MRKTVKIFIILLIIFFYGNSIVYAENTESEEILESQKESLNLSDFLSESQKYVDENLEGLDVEALLNSAIKGKVEDENILKDIFNIFGDEVKNSITIMRKYIGNSFNT